MCGVAPAGGRGAGGVGMAARRAGGHVGAVVGVNVGAVDRVAARGRRTSLEG